MSKLDSLRRQCRTLESLLDTKLTTYSRLASTVSTASYSDLESGRWGDIENEIEGLLEKLRDTNEEMVALLNDPDAPPTQSSLHAIQRHRDILQDYARDFAQTRVNAKSALDRANLLTTVRNDIDAYKAAQSSAADSLLAERGRIDSSHRMTDDILEQAYETRAEFSRQRSTLGTINTRMGQVLGSFPGINNLVSMISSRRRRDSLILGCVIGICIIVLLSYTSR